MTLTLKRPPWTSFERSKKAAVPLKFFSTAPIKSQIEDGKLHFLQIGQRCACHWDISSLKWKDKLLAKKPYLVTNNEHFPGYEIDNAKRRN